MRRRTQLLFALLGAVCTLATLPAPSAVAASNPAISDCVAHGALTKSYSIAALRQALNSMSPTTKEYTNCSDVINRALAAAVSKGGGGTGTNGSGSFLPTPVIIILVILVLAAVSFGALEIRRRRGSPGSGGRGGP